MAKETVKGETKEIGKLPLRLRKEDYDRLAANVKKYGYKSMNEVVGKLVEGWNAHPDPKDPDAPRQFGSHAIHLQRRAKILADAVTEYLSSNSEWARRAILKADLGGSGNWAFGERFEHFPEEKEYIAAQFLPWLIHRVESLPDRGAGTYIVLDSGTTAYWAFRELANLLRKNKGLRDITLLSNNIPGVEAYLNECRTDGNTAATCNDLPDRVTCTLLPGKAQSEYAAVTGSETEKMLLQIRQQNPTANFIGITTGNWVRLRRTLPVHPIPLARGEGHKQFKEVLIEVCQEVYLLSNLSKLVVNHSLEEINAAFALDPQYRDVEVKADKFDSIRLVSTTRADPQALLFGHAAALRSSLKKCGPLPSLEQAGASFDSLSHICLPFDKFSRESKEEQLLVEFPHAYVRKHLEMFTVGDIA